MRPSEATSCTHEQGPWQAVPRAASARLALTQEAARLLAQNPAVVYLAAAQAVDHRLLQRLGPCATRGAAAGIGGGGGGGAATFTPCGLHCGAHVGPHVQVGLQCGGRMGGAGREGRGEGGREKRCWARHVRVALAETAWQAGGQWASLHNGTSGCGLLVRFDERGEAQL